MKYTLLLISFALISHSGISQNVGIGNPNPSPSAMLDVASTDKGILIPRMNSGQRIAIPAPAEGLMVYQTDAPGEFFIFKNGTWQILATAGGADSQVQFNNNGTLGGAAKATINGGYLNVGTTTTPPATPASGVNLFTQSRTGRGMLSQVNYAGSVNSFQPFFGQKRISWWSASGNGGNVSSEGIGNTSMGTSETRNVSISNLFSAARRSGYTSSFASGSSAGTRHNVLQFFIGNTPGMGGFYYIARFGISSSSTIFTQRSFIGFAGQAGLLPNANPSTNPNIVGFGNDSFDGSWSFMHNDASGTAVKDAVTGGNSPILSNTDLLEIRIYCAPNSSTVYFSMEILGGGSYFEGSTNADLPINTLLSPQIWTNNGTTVNSVGIDIVYQYLETDY